LCVAPPVRKAAFERRLANKVTRILERARRDAGEAEARVIACHGSPAAVIATKAEDYDLTVIGAKGAGAGSNAGLGPVASRVAEHATDPILIGRELRSESGTRVLIAADGSNASLSAIRTLTSLFDLDGSEITLMHVAETPWVHVALEDEWDTYDEAEKDATEAGIFEKEMTREGEIIVEQARDLVGGAAASVETILEQGNPAEEILSEADRGQYDLVVAGASGTRDLKHSMLGSVSAKIAWNAPCSVLIVREPV